MASIAILPGNKNLWIAHAIAQDSNGEVIENGNGIVIRAPKITIDRFNVEHAAGKSLTDGAWQSFTLNKIGRVTELTADSIVIED